MANIDISQLAIDRQAEQQIRRGRPHLVSRFLVPGLIVFCFLVLMSWAGWDFLFPPRDVRVMPVVVSVAESRVEGTPLFNAAGWIEPRPTAIRVAALAPGVVEKLLVVEDQPVQKGEPVAELIREDAQLQFEGAVADRQLAEAELEKANASLVAAKTKLKQPVHLEAELSGAEAALAKVQTMLQNLTFETERATSRLDLAKKNHQRNLDAGASVSQRERDETGTTLETAEASLRELTERRQALSAEEKALVAQKKAMKTQLDLLADEIRARDQALATVQAGKAKVAQRKVTEAEAKLRLSRMTIRAPVDGRVYQLVGLPGTRVGVGIMTAIEKHDGSSVITMYQPTSLQIRVDVRFQDIPKVSLMQEVEIKNPALKEPISGKVLFVSSEADIQKNTLQVKVSINTPPAFFKPEMLVDVTFLAPAVKQGGSSRNRESRIFVPRSCVQSSEEGEFVWTADRSEGRAARSPVKTGVANGTLVEIVEGLRIDSRIIVNGIDTLQPGKRIRIVGEETGELR
ncbi:MAG: efflux RND transporter periplasmic adaptor subunit [Planctomycetota bacterium]|nr:efflux RND transporter periplasmic adaptor subunit [Planctomycetota bacterium]